MTGVEEINQEIQQHLEAAYALLPSKLNPGSLHTKQKHLEKSYQNKEWRQVFYNLQSLSNKNEFSAELIHHIESTENLFTLYDRLGMRMALEKLTGEEKRVIGECLRATAFGPFFPDWEFHALFGVNRDEAIRVAQSWPNLEESDISASYLINDSMNNLLSYPHRKQSEWKKYVSMPPNKIYGILNRFRTLTGKRNNQQTGSAEYFHNMGA